MAPPTTVTRDDIQAKLREIKGEVDSGTQAAKPIALAAGVVVVVAAVGLAFLLGKRRGTKRATFVEIRRV